MTKRKTISIGIPCYNEELNVLPAYKELERVAKQNKKYDFEFVYVDNGSEDKTRDEIRKVVKKDKRVKGVFLSRNFGPEASGQATLDHSSGDAYVMYEGDMQDPPELISDFIKEWEDGYDVVVGVRNKIDDDFLMTFIRKTYYRIFRAFSNIDVPVNAGSYGLLDKQVMDEIKKLPEKYRFFRGLRAWVGFKTDFVNYERRSRQRGKSSYNFFGYLKHAERSFFGFSYLPLDIIIYLGFLLVIPVFIVVLFYIFRYIIFGQTIKESAIIILSIVFFGGIQLIAISIIGKYIQVIVEETKSRPSYIVEEVLKK